MDVTLSHDSDGKEIADVSICIDLAELEAQYRYLLMHAGILRSVSEDKRIGKVGTIPDALDGVLRLFESINQKVAEVR